MIIRPDNKFTLLLPGFLTFTAIIFSQIGYSLMAIAVVGLSLGFIMQRSRFCIASAFSDFLLFRDGNLLKALVAFIFVSTLGFTFIQITGGEGYLVTVGWRTVLGALLFGFGMTIAGGCAAGTLMRIGEGYLLFIPTLLGLIFGSVMGAYHYGLWGSIKHSSVVVFFPEVFGWPIAILVQLLVLVGIMVLILHFEKAAKNEMLRKEGGENHSI
ncbi:YeeE/YedE family protein [Metallumcola ferriviriculae]|uniref:YeeE/YedE family protein n=1 Tax=Metallumcola ferriviriculae TaxID=3039180 RepID=A0AAU0UQU0_9FIRM|nr:YeeE/YedE family protein [Desulfitibacteraceae bacterium MK1]